MREPIRKYVCDFLNSVRFSIGMKGREMAMVEVGLSGQMFDATSIWEHLKAAAEIGYRSVEIRSTHINPKTSREEKEKVQAFLNAEGITVNCLSCFTGNYGLLTDDKCEEAYEVFKEYILLARLLDSKMIRVWPAWQESAKAPEEVWKRAARWMRKSGEYAAQYGKRLVMEMHHGTLCDRAESSIRLMDMIDLDNVGVTLDPVNLYQVPADYGMDAVKKLGRLIFNVHIKDIVQLKSASYTYGFPYSYYSTHIGKFTTVVPSIVEEERYYCHRRINQGGVDWHEVLSALDHVEYNGRLIVESVSETNRDMPSGYDLAKMCFEDVSALLKSNRSSGIQTRDNTVELKKPGSEPVKADNRIKSAFFCNVSANIDRVYSPEKKNLIAADSELYPTVITSSNFEMYAEELKDLDVIFSTWGIPVLTSEMLDRLPSLKAVFYAASSVKGFAVPLLERGIRVISAWRCNGTPVAEFTLAQILLSGKGYFKNIQDCKSTEKFHAGETFHGRGNYNETISIIGAGATGRSLIKLLKNFKLKVIVYDPYLDEKEAALLGVEKVSLESVFERGNVVSNHVPDIPATRRMLTGTLFDSMRREATFINSGRGPTVAEDEMIEVLKRRPDLTALLDVTEIEPPLMDSPLYQMPNVYLSSHIAGALGNEVGWLVDGLIEEFAAWKEGKALRYEVTLEKLNIMA